MEQSTRFIGMDGHKETIVVAITATGDIGRATPYEAMRREDAAVHALTTARDILERGAGRETVRVAYAELELARLYQEQGRGDEADAASRDARRILNKAEAEEHKREREV